MPGVRVLSAVVGALLVAPLVGGAASGVTYVYVSSADAAKSAIHLFRLQTENLEVSQNITLVPLGIAAETAKPGFLEVDAQRRFLFAANEVDDFGGKPTGAVTAFAIDQANGTLTAINQRPSMGQRPCFLALDKGQQRLLVANCASGTLAVLPVGADGKLGEALTVTKATEKPPNAPDTRTACLTLDPANRFALACEFAGNRLQEFQFDAARGTLTPGAAASTHVTEGKGPQDIVFRPDGKFAYVANALNSTITVFGYDAATGALKELQTLPTVPPYYDGPNAAAELAVHPTGKWLYVSNRGHNSVVLFTIDPGTGLLTFVEEQGTGGKNPVHFGIEPSAKHLAIANQGSNTVLVCRIDAGNGRLKPSGVFASVPSPVFVKFLPPAGTDAASQP